MNPDTNSGQFWNVIFVWAIAALGGMLACALLYNFAEIGITGAVFLAGILAIGAGAALHWGMLTELPPVGNMAKPAAPPAPKPPQQKAEVKPAPKAKAAPAPKPTPKPKAAPAPKREPEPAVAVVAAEAGKPATLSAARGGVADDLKKIKGVGPKLEGLLHSMGFYHFDQLAGWTTDEIAWVDENLEGFKGRVSRDTWVDQAKVLAAGEDTAFSKKVDKGGVY